MIGILLTLIVVGLILHLVLTYVPMAAPVKTVLLVVVVIFLCLWLLRVFGIADMPVPRLR